MSDEHPKRSDLWEMAESLSKPTDATMFFQQFVEALARGEFAEAHARAILNTGLQTLMTATQNDPDAAGEIIIHHILPICLEQDSSIDKKISGYDHLREFTAGWIEQYPDDRKIGLRKRILAAALNATSTLHARAALWTISAIGLRAPEIEDRLARLSKLSDALGDTAITCLIGLQPQEELKTQLVRKILRRLPQRPIESFNRAIQESADPRFIRVLNRRLSQRAGDSWHEVSLLGRIADGAPGDQALQERIWRILNRALQSNQEVRGGALIAGNGIAACTTSKVIPGLLACLVLVKTEREWHALAIELVTRHGEDFFRACTDAQRAAFASFTVDIRSSS